MAKSSLIRNKHLIHPDYAAWRRLKLQMSKEQVLELLGPPRADRMHQWEYGCIRFPRRLFRRPFWFLLYSDASERLIIIEHPFGSSPPRDGKPSVPVILYPQSQTTCSQYPGYFDIRWDVPNFI